VEIPPLWSSAQSSWLQIQRSRFYSRRYQIFWEVVGPERGSLSLVSKTEELIERKSGSGLEIREYGSRDPSSWPRGTLYRQKLTLTSPTSGSRSVGIVRLRTKTTEFSLVWNSKFEFDWKLFHSRRQSLPITYIFFLCLLHTFPSFLPFSVKSLKQVTPIPFS
jgi:hypothetical protein